jgi:hypothetical protein
VELTPAQGNILLGLAALSFVAGMGLIVWAWVGRLWAWARRHRRYLWIVGGPLLFGLLLGGMEWLISGSLYNALGIGAAAYAPAQLSFMVWVRRLAHSQEQIEQDEDSVRQSLQLSGVTHAEIERLKREVDRLQQEVNSHDADRDAYWGLLAAALREGLSLRESAPSKEDVQKWTIHLHKLIENAQGEQAVKPFRRPTPGYAYADLDASGEQVFMDYRLAKLQDLIRRVESGQIIKFRADFDPHEWKDWKSPPPTSSTAKPTTIPEHMISERHIRYHDSPIRLVDLVDLVGEHGAIIGFTFEHCILEGPGIITFMGPGPNIASGSGATGNLLVGPTHCRVEGSPETVLYEIKPDGKRPVGAIQLAGGRFEAVTFRGLGFAGTPDELAWLRKHLIFSEGSSDQ